MANFYLLNQIREMILSGELEPGERLTETRLADKLNVSRTPIRSVLPTLATDGFIEPFGKRGYTVKRFNKDEILKTLELRCILEGVAARYLAEQGASERLLEKLKACLGRGDKIFTKRYLKVDDEERYGEMNAEFHRLIVDNCRFPMLISFVNRLNTSPFINTATIVFDHVGLDYAYDALFRAHGQHHSIVEAIENKEASRVEAIFREHGNAQKRSLFVRGINKQGASPVRGGLIGSVEGLL